jgi:hypothetical protein
MDTIGWVHKNCKFANEQEQKKPPIGHQSVLDFDPSGTFTPDPKQLQHPEFHRDISDTAVERDDPEFVGGFYHVTTNLPAVLHWGALKSRKQLGDTGPGLGGGFENQSPNKISVTYNSQKAFEIYEMLEFASMTAHNKVTAEQILNFVTGNFGAEITPDSNVIGVLKWFGISKRVLRDEFFEGLEEELNKRIITGEQKYEFLIQLEDALGKDESEFDSGGDYSAPKRVGLTVPFETFSQINPENIGIVQLEARKDAQPEHVQQELELRFNAEDLRLAPNPIVRRAILWVQKVCKFAGGLAGTPHGDKNKGTFGFSRIFDLACFTLQSNLRLKPLSKTAHVAIYAFDEDAKPEQQIRLSWGNYDDPENKGIKIRILENNVNSFLNWGNLDGQQKKAEYIIRTDKLHAIAPCDFNQIIDQAATDLSKRSNNRMFGKEKNTGTETRMSFNLLNEVSLK